MAKNSNDKPQKQYLSFPVVFESLDQLQKMATLQDDDLYLELIDIFKDQIDDCINNPDCALNESIYEFNNEDNYLNMHVYVCNIYINLIFFYYLAKLNLRELKDEELEKLEDIIDLILSIIFKKANPRDEKNYQFLARTRFNIYYLYYNLHSLLTDTPESENNSLREMHLMLFTLLVKNKKINHAIKYYKKNKFAISEYDFIHILDRYLSEIDIKQLDRATTSFILNEIEKIKVFDAEEYKNCKDKFSNPDFNHILKLYIEFASIVAELYYDYHYRSKTLYKSNVHYHIFKQLERYFPKDEIEAIEIDADDEAISKYSTYKDSREVFKKIWHDIKTNNLFLNTCHYGDVDDPYHTIIEEIIGNISLNENNSEVINFEMIQYEAIGSFSNVLFNFLIEAIIVLRKDKENTLEHQYTQGTYLKEDSIQYHYYDESFVSIKCKQLITETIDLLIAAYNWNQGLVTKDSKIFDFADALNKHNEKLNEDFVSDLIKKNLTNMTPDKIDEAAKEFFKSNYYQGYKIPDSSFNEVYDNFEKSQDIKNILATNEIMFAPFKDIDDSLAFGDYTNMVVCQIKSLERYLKEIILEVAKRNNKHLCLYMKNTLTLVNTIPLNNNDWNYRYLHVDDNTTIEDICGQTQSHFSPEIGPCMGLIWREKELFLKSPSENSIFYSRNGKPMNARLYQCWVSSVRNNYMHVKEINSLSAAKIISKSTAYWLLKAADELIKM